MLKKYMPVTSKINDNGCFEIGGVSTIDLAKKYGTPLYVVDEETLRENCRAYIAAFETYYPKTEIVFASKALSVTGILRIVAGEKLGADVSSGGELYTALKASLDPKKIYFHGNNKPIKEIEEGIEANIGCFVADNIEEIENIEKIAIKKNKTISIMLRVNPGIEAHTHDFIKTGIIDSKFGIQKEKVLDIVKIVKDMPHLEFAGLHAHIGSQIYEIQPFVEEVKLLCKLAKDIKDKLRLATPKINIGGGLGVPYLEKDPAPSIEKFAKTIGQTLEADSKKYGLELPVLVLEPGRSIVATAGITLYTVGSIKDIPSVRKYVITDGGMSDNPRPILYQAKYEVLVANKAGNKKTEKVTVAGRFCESGDILFKDVKIQTVGPGDVLASFCTGAYNYSMASNYNRVTRPAMVIVNKGQTRIIVKRETYEDLAHLDN